MIQENDQNAARKLRKPYNCSKTSGFPWRKGSSSLLGLNPEDKSISFTSVVFRKHCSSHRHFIKQFVGTISLPSSVTISAEIMPGFWPQSLTKLSQEDPDSHFGINERMSNPNSSRTKS
ncbi:hypothetical protein L6452_05248 [Arctium lappa]|uniref:Uncharacterized protein n=1 Tax=Arctium lappa TaxID=4217 RepID=A0ACB9EG62_ARCLA|nr:hypothetical protein L6452_05248 [Arctium lappa]